VSRSGSDSPPTPACLAEALALIEAGLDFVNGADVPGLPLAVQADALRMWIMLDAKRTAAEAALVNAFDATEGYAADGQSSTSSWLSFFTRCTATAARQAVAAARRLRDHLSVARALAAGRISASVGKLIIDFCGKLPAEDQEAAEQVLTDAAGEGADAADLSLLAAEIYRRVYPNGIERDEERAAADRGLTLGKTFGGVGRLNGDLTAHATSLAEQVIGALSRRKGPEDTRTARQRRHDALAEAFSLLVGSNLMPERGGAKPQVKVDIPLAALRRLPGAADAVNEWIRLKARQLAADPGLDTGPNGGPNSGPNGAPDRTLSCPAPDGCHKHPEGGSCTVVSDVCKPPGTTEGSGTTNAGADVLTRLGLPPASAGPPAILGDVGPVSERMAAALACDSVVTPTVTGAVDRQALTGMTEEWLRGHGLAGHNMSPAARHRLRETLLRWAVEVLSGPGGLASYLRTGRYDGSLASPSIVLDVGRPTKTVPAHLEQAVRRRDRHCRWPGCDRPAELSQVHHIVPRAAGGLTKLGNLLTLCDFHHLTAVHTWGWTVRLGGDGTTTATSRGGRNLREADPTLRRSSGAGPPAEP
jgi:hypothetical protein